MAVTDMEDDSYIKRFQALRMEEDTLVQKILNSYGVYDGETAERLAVVRAEKATLEDRLIKDRQYLKDTSSIDALTGLYNRRILDKAREFGTVVMFDIDFFKGVNDKYGHAAGDDALRAVGQSIRKHTRIGDIGCRYGGDEFLIIFNTNLKEIISQRMNEIAAEANQILAPKGLHITISVGVAFNTENEDLKTVIEKADQALYMSKENGRNQITYFDPETVLKRKG